MQYVNTYSYGPFGELSESIEGVTNPFKFSTQYQDEESGFIYYGFRYYNYISGRWLNRDPLGDTGGLNLYGFVKNDSVNTYDILGLISKEQVKQQNKAAKRTYARVRDELIRLGGMVARCAEDIKIEGQRKRLFGAFGQYLNDIKSAAIKSAQLLEENSGYGSLFYEALATQYGGQDSIYDVSTVYMDLPLSFGRLMPDKQFIADMRAAGDRYNASITVHANGLGALETTTRYVGYAADGASLALGGGAVLTGLRKAFVECGIKAGTKLLGKTLVTAAAGELLNKGVAAAGDALGIDEYYIDLATRAVDILTMAKNIRRAKKPHCFVAGTKVKTIDGSKNIEDIEVGDVVYSRNEITGETGYKRVQRVFKNSAQKLVTLTYRRINTATSHASIDRGSAEDGEITSTNGHRIWSEDREAWLDMGSLYQGEKVLLDNGEQASVIEINSIIPDADFITIYNFTVEDWHTYYVSSDNTFVWVHNDDCDTANSNAESLTQGRDEKGRFLPKNGGELPPGGAAEKAALDRRGMSKNTDRIPSNNNPNVNYRIPDGMDASGRNITEVKDVDKLSYTDQLKDYVDYVTREGGTGSVEIVIDRRTEPSQTLKDAAADPNNPIFLTPEDLR